MAKEQAEQFLTSFFRKSQVEALLRHFSGMVHEFQKGEWEDCIAKAGKFTEALLKTLYSYTGKTPPGGRAFKADTIINELGQLPAGSYDDSVRLTIPRACRFVYDIASNRGGRHDPDGIDPNEMDANAAISNCSWILAEMIRISQKDSADPGEAKKLVDALTEKKFPLAEEVDGRVYFHLKKRAATDVALLALALRHPRRIPKQGLIDTVKRNGFKDANARMAVQRVMRFVDNDGQDRLRLLATGLREAERIMKEKSQ